MNVKFHYLQQIAKKYHKKNLLNVYFDVDHVKYLLGYPKFSLFKNAHSYPFFRSIVTPENKIIHQQFIYNEQ